MEDSDIARGLCNYARDNEIDNIVIGASHKTALGRLKNAADVTGGVLKGAPDFCTVYVINKGKVSTVKKATACNLHHRTAPHAGAINSFQGNTNINGSRGSSADWPFRTSKNYTDGNDSIRSPFSRNRTTKLSFGATSMDGLDISFVGSRESDISFVSTNRPSSDWYLSSFTESQGSNFASRISCSTDRDHKISFESDFSGSSSDANNHHGVFSQTSQQSWGSASMMDETEEEIRRLKQELKQMIDMYSNACKEAITAKQKTAEFNQWKAEEQQKVKEATLAQEAALEMAEREQAKCKAAIEAAEAAQRIAELEGQKRKNAEWKALKEEEEKNKVLNALSSTDARYRRYSIEEIEVATENFSKALKIGEGGYGPVYKGYLDHTPVAIKVLHPDAIQGQSQFQQEVDVLSCMRHPNMVLLLGACPTYGCLIYEYMANGSLDDCLFRPGTRPVLSWQMRFRIAAEIATGLLFLHQAKPEPLVHRDLKPGNILLDGNYVSKISDVGLARLVPPSVADTVTQYRLTSAAGTFCYIDPEYQQTGMLGTKSDVYSLGVMLLQIISAKSPMGLTHHIERSIEIGTFKEMLDPAIQNWPIDEALDFAKLALRCTELRRKDRPDLRTVVLPELNRLSSIAEDSRQT
ncbi:hypothetical protein Leryth_001015 [Lithospermum erythrorhizon]|nr:hypothetical protein Leryth_001015 [Lithospermum erythrorhizon]